jgi:hypothetical protein
METTPPPLPSPKNLGRATALNLFLPGAGLIYLGHWVAGWALALSFFSCLTASLAIFLSGYARYLSLTLSGNIMQGEHLEELSHVFHPGWLLGLLLAGVSIYIVSLVALFFARRKIPKPTHLQA